MRVLRELVLSEVPLSRAEISRRTGLSVPGAAGALRKLHDSGIVEPVGAGPRQGVQLRERHPLRGMLEALFHQEASRIPALMDELRALVEATAPTVRAAWIAGPAAVEADHRNEPLVLSFLAGARDVSALAASLREEVARVERDYDVTIEVLGRTEADLATLDSAGERLLAGARPLLGPHPGAYLDPPRDARAASGARAPASHAAHDLRALLAAAWIAERLDRDPDLPKRARRWLVHRLHDSPVQEAHELNEWLRLLDTASIPRLQYLLRDTGERSTRLRQSNPFLPVLTDEERRAMREEVGGRG